MSSDEIGITHIAVFFLIDVSVGLNLATTKPEAVLFPHRRRFSPPSFHLKGEQIRLCTALKYLGL